MNEIPACPKCQSALVYEDGPLYVCPECAHEWPRTAETVDSAADSGNAEALLVLDANGNRLQDDDTVTIVKDLKVKGASAPLKVGTKVKGIRLVEGYHNIDCRIVGFGAMKLKSDFVRKA